MSASLSLSLGHIHPLAGPMEVVLPTAQHSIAHHTLPGLSTPQGLPGRKRPLPSQIPNIYQLQEITTEYNNWMISVFTLHELKWNDLDKVALL